jgi:hypothetical protein
LEHKNGALMQVFIFTTQRLFSGVCDLPAPIQQSVCDKLSLNDVANEFGVDTDMIGNPLRILTANLVQP